MTDRQGDWFQTWTGVRFYPYDPRPEEIEFEDIAHHLSLLCRFNGAVREFYSVAQHSVIVARHLPPELQLWGLLHDATEAYLGDMVRPLKLGMPQYREAERKVEECIVKRFHLSPAQMPPEVKEMDNRVLYTERRDLLKVQRQWSQDIQPLGLAITPWSPLEAYLQFSRLFVELEKMRKREPASPCLTCGGSGEVSAGTCTCGGIDIGVGVMHEPTCGREQCPDCGGSGRAGGGEP